MTVRRPTTGSGSVPPGALSPRCLSHAWDGAGAPRTPCASPSRDGRWWAGRLEDPEPALVPTRYGEALVFAFPRKDPDGRYMPELEVADYRSRPTPSVVDPFVRIHSECRTGHLDSLRCECRAQLEAALTICGESANGLVVIETAHEGRGIGLANKLRAYRLQEAYGIDTNEANRWLGFAEDERSYTHAVAALRWLGIRSARLLTANPMKVAAVEAAGIEVVETSAVDIPDLSPEQERYLAAKENAWRRGR
jgi:GTP cyclohydrolase II